MSLSLQIHGTTMTVTLDQLVQALALNGEDRQLATLMTKVGMTLLMTRQREAIVQV
jgi:insecticidal toxin